MRRIFSGFVVFAIALGLVLQLLRAAGLITGGECDPACACSAGDPACRCGHKTCLAPLAG